MKPRKSSAMTIRIFQSASAKTMIDPVTSVTIAARRAVVPIPGFLPAAAKGGTPMLEQEEQICLDARRHGIVLLRPLSRAAAFALLGAVGFAVGWPASLAGAVLLAAAAVVATVAVWRWDRTHVVVTTEK